MSKTIRIKNYAREHNTSWDRRGSKIALEYTHCVWGYYCPDYYREPTKAERFKRYYQMHGESSCGNNRSPGKEYRRYRNKQNRSITRQELYKYFTIEDYEPMIEEEPRSCWWDWD